MCLPVLVYNHYEDKMIHSEEDLESYQVQQEAFYNTVFLPYLRNESEKNSEFLSQFVECCTGSSCLPYVVAGGNPVQIQVVFELNVDAL
jgi:hypothetical protein